MYVHDPVGIGKVHMMVHRWLNIVENWAPQIYVCGAACICLLGIVAVCGELKDGSPFGAKLKASHGDSVVLMVALSGDGKEAFRIPGSGSYVFAMEWCKGSVDRLKPTCGDRFYGCENRQLKR